ncbi:hypothetical protein Tco_0985538 [Tanacetum coccineum]
MHVYPWPIIELNVDCPTKKAAVCQHPMNHVCVQPRKSFVQGQCPKQKKVAARVNCSQEQQPQANGNILLSDLVAKIVNGKKGREITTASFNNNTSPSEVPLISHMLKVAKLSKHEKTLLISSREVNIDSTADKSFVWGPCSKPKKPLAETQHAKEPMATVDTTKSLDACELAEEVAKQPSTTAIKNEHETKANENVVEDHMDTDAGITFMGATTPDKIIEEAESDVESMPDDEILFILGDDDEELEDITTNISVAPAIELMDPLTPHADATIEGENNAQPDIKISDDQSDPTSA